MPFSEISLSKTQLQLLKDASARAVPVTAENESDLEYLKSLGLLEIVPEFIPIHPETDAVPGSVAKALPRGSQYLAYLDAAKSLFRKNLLVSVIVAALTGLFTALFTKLIG